MTSCARCSAAEQEAFGERQMVELRDGGRLIPVTSENRIEYVHAMADYRLNRQVAFIAYLDA